MANPLNILHLASSERWTGVAEPVTSLALYQQKSGKANVRLACIPGRSFERHARRHGIEVLDSLAFPRNYSPVKTVRDIKVLRRIVKEQNIDIVHCHLSHDHWLAAVALRALGRERVVLVRSYHRFEKPYRDPLHRWLFLEATNCVITPTRALASILKENLFGDYGRVHVVHGAVNTERFNPSVSPALMLEKMKISSGTPIAGLVARLRKDRGIHWLLDTVPRVVEKVPDAKFVLVGRGELKYWLKDYIAKSFHGERLVRAGYQKENLPETYAAFDCSLFLGLGSDGSSRAVLEAMAMGKPVIALNTGGLDEVITPGETGVLVTPGSRDELADAIIVLLSDKEKCRRMGINARHVIEQHFTEERRALDTLDVYTHYL